MPAAPLVVRRRYLMVVPKPLPAAPLVLCRRYLIVVPRPFQRRRDTGAAQILGRGAQAIARGAAHCAP